MPHDFAFYSEHVEAKVSEIGQFSHEAIFMCSNKLSIAQKYHP
jgi:hypothetical protein